MYKYNVYYFTRVIGGYMFGTNKIESMVLNLIDKTIGKRFKIVDEITDVFQGIEPDVRDLKNEVKGMKSDIKDLKKIVKKLTKKKQMA